MGELEFVRQSKWAPRGQGDSQLGKGGGGERKVSVGNSWGSAGKQTFLLSRLVFNRLGLGSFRLRTVLPEVALTPSRGGPVKLLRMVHRYKQLYTHPRLGDKALSFFFL